MNHGYDIDGYPDVPEDAVQEIQRLTEGLHSLCEFLGATPATADEMKNPAFLVRASIVRSPAWLRWKMADLQERIGYLATCLDPDAIEYIEKAFRDWRGYKISAN